MGKKYTYICARHRKEIKREYNTLGEALDRACGDLAFDLAYPLDILCDGEALWSNRGGFPLTKGSCPLLDRLDQHAEEKKYDWY